MIPLNVSTGRVEGRFLIGVQDGPDPGDDPDFIQAVGTIEFTASVPYLPNPTASDGPVTLLKTTISGILDGEGYLCTITPAGSAGVRGLRLVATDDPDLLVQGWTWNVTYRFQPVNGAALTIPAHSIAVPSEGSVDLTTAMKVPSSPGYGLPQAEAAVNETITGATVVGDDLQLTRRSGELFIAGDVRGRPGADSTVPGPPGPVSTVPGPQGADSTVPGPKGDPGPSGVSNTDQFYSVSQTAGRTVSIWDYLNNRYQLVYGDTGVRSLPVPNVAPLNGVGAITISRQNREVTLVLDNVEYIGSSTTEYLTAAGFIPVGFRPGYSENPSSVLTNNNANATYPVAVLQASRMRRMGPALTGNEPGLGTNAFRGTIKWKTDEAWPTSLPGSAVGAIPYQ